MNKIVDVLIKFMISRKVIATDKDTIAFYSYGIEITISSLLNIVLIIILGLLTNRFAESIAFLSAFVFLRSFMGGYHADTYFRCNALMCFLFLLLILIYNKLGAYFTPIMIIPMLAASLIITFIYCPVENKNKPIPKERIKPLKLKSLIFCTAFYIIGAVALYQKIQLGVMLVLTTFLISILVIAAKIKEGGLANGLRCKNS